ncbi:16S rRNA (guanine(966)-N(2))-methyltransferase RsmD [Helicobacter sp.]|uniref:16S rRNA (guanine(966)-N(2))-methyltransferase RsmD n=1 Tax=Helicobacter sp. TaxID=218 RepID=UPI0025C705C2|nr:16S rRNA (guanine(966)-N(2))-methyltransferase RsmD [Helicobacter sp.]MBR2494797.1 16S rRNA (guanine(966)-N(2))-methyltransferase RsmD [Helicobacter sp.]
MRARKQAKQVSVRSCPHTKSLKLLRVCGGKWRGLKLFVPESRLDSSSFTRPTKSIVKESCFNSLAGEIYGACFIEAFAGSGSMGIEALSRGASVAIFCECETKALETLQKNLSLLPIVVLESMAISCRENPCAYIARGDSFVILGEILRSCELPSILYLDPPFCIRQNYADIYEKCASLIGSIASPNLKHIIIEHSSEYKFADVIGDFSKSKSKRFGKSTLTYFTQGA